MKSHVLYRVAAVLLVLFGLGHTLGFRDHEPSWGVDGVLALMHTVHFNVQGFSRSYWDLFQAAGFCVGVYYFFAAILAWQLGGLPPSTLAQMRTTAWALALSFAAIGVISWMFLFWLPIVFSVVITLLLAVAAL
jgi:hypothetical protein